MTICLIVDDKIGDPIADYVSHHPDPDIDIVTLSAFFRRAGVGVTQAGRLSFTPADEDFGILIDRVVDISQMTIEALGGPRPLLCRGQIWDMYHKLLSRASGAPHFGPPAGMGKSLALPTQWLLVERRHLAVKTPRFVHGYGPEPADASGLGRCIYKSPFDLYDWQPNAPPDGMIWDQFVVERPAGRPVLAYALAGRVVVEPLDGAPLDPADDRRVAAAFAEVMRLFEASIGEALWFVDQADIIFAAFSRFLSGAANCPSFDAEMAQFLRHVPRAGFGSVAH